LRLQIKLRGDRKEPGDAPGTASAGLSMQVDEEPEETPPAKPH
jgi:twitching motility protein PilU